MDEPENPVTGFPVSVQNHIFATEILSAIFVMLAMYYVITPFGGWINGGIRTVLTAAGEKGALMYAMGIAAATAIDLGGPIKQSSRFRCLQLYH